MKPFYGKMADNAKVVNGEIGELSKLQIDGEKPEPLNFVFVFVFYCLNLVFVNFVFFEQNVRVGGTGKLRNCRPKLHHAILLMKQVRKNGIVLDVVVDTLSQKRKNVQKPCKMAGDQYVSAALKSGLIWPKSP